MSEGSSFVFFPGPRLTRRILNIWVLSKTGKKLPYHVHVDRMTLDVDKFLKTVLDKAGFEEDQPVKLSALHQDENYQTNWVSER